MHYLISLFLTILAQIEVAPEAEATMGNLDTIGLLFGAVLLIVLVIYGFKSLGKNGKYERRGREFTEFGIKFEEITGQDYMWNSSPAHQKREDDAVREALVSAQAHVYLARANHNNLTSESTADEFTSSVEAIRLAEEKLAQLTSFFMKGEFHWVIKLFDPNSPEHQKFKSEAAAKFTELQQQPQKRGSRNPLAGSDSSSAEGPSVLKNPVAWVKHVLKGGNEEEQSDPVATAPDPTAPPNIGLNRQSLGNAPTLGKPGAGAQSGTPRVAVPGGINTPSRASRAQMEQDESDQDGEQHPDHIPFDNFE